MAQQIDHRDYLTVDKAAAELGMSKKRLQNMIYDKKVPARAISIGKLNGKKYINVKILKGL